MIANEEEKRVHLKGIINKLKTQKNEHSLVIDTLISENDQLSREVLKSEREVRYKCAILIWFKNHLQFVTQIRASNVNEEISEGKLRAVSCLKGNLIEELDDQSSLILEQSGEVAALKILVEEMTIKNQHLETKYR